MENREERPPERPGQRLVYVDMAKCVMLMFVIVSHTEAWRLELPVDPILISTFWICSGYTSGPSVSLRRKATGLLVPYFAMSALCLLFSWLVAGRDIVSRDILGILYSRYVALAAPASETNPCLMPLCNSPLWFLTSLFTGFCVYASLMRIRTLRTQTLAAGLCLALAWAATYLPVLLPWSIDTALFAGPMIWAGHQMRRFNVLESLWKLIRLAPGMGQCQRARIRPLVAGAGPLLADGGARADVAVQGLRTQPRRASAFGNQPPGSLYLRNADDVHQSCAPAPAVHGRMAADACRRTAVEHMRRLGDGPGHVVAHTACLMSLRKDPLKFARKVEANLREVRLRHLQDVV